MTDFTVCTATELADLYCAGSASPVTVAEQVLAKIERVNPVLNAFCFTDPATTLQQARASANRWRQGQPLSKLDGIPIGIKDLLLTQGWPTLKGSFDIDADQPWPEDNPYVAKLRSAGAVFLGKTTTSEYGTRPDGYSARHGFTRNPWNISKTAGGSSAGSAAAVSAGLGPISIGSDQGGSISRPSAFCGVVGFKPTGHTVIGPIANTVEDCELVHGLSFDCLPVDLQKIKIAFCDDKKYNLHTDIFDFAINKIKKYFELIQITLDIDLYNVLDWQSQILLYNNQQKFLQFSDQQEQELLRGWATLEEIKNISSTKIKIAQFRLDQICDYMQTFMQEFDIIITTASNSTAVDVNSISPIVIYRDVPPDYHTLWNITQQPAVTIPIGLVEGLPVGIQIVGSVGHDDLVLQFAKLIQPLFDILHPNMFYKTDHSST
jgi:aspartyl-tRNA(Asn)/glutamyl-tRNA(Gln) amidotransferase subunit A